MGIAAVCQQPVDADGLVFDPVSITTERIAEDADYHGVRAKFRGTLGNGQIAMQIDIGFSDVVTPAPVDITYPTILDLPAAQLRAYNRETVIAEKFEAMVKLGVLNSRMKDFFDIWLLSQNYEFNGAVLANAIAKTFEQRGPVIAPDAICLTPDFAQHPSKAIQWKAFLRNGRLVKVPAEFTEVTDRVRRFLQPAVEALAAGSSFNMVWLPPGPWKR